MVELSSAYSDSELDDPGDDYWVICLQNVGGSPAILRLISGVPEAIAAEGYEDRVTVVWSYDPEPDGLPKDADSARMDFFEDVLVEAVEGRMNACLAIVTTSKGNKEWTIYSDAAVRIAEFVGQLAQANGLPVDLRCDKDPDWGAYYTLMAAAEDE